MSPDCRLTRKNPLDPCGQDWVPDPNADVIQHREDRNLGRHHLFGLRPTMEWVTRSSRSETAVENLSRDVAQQGEHLLCKQPALNAVVYRTGTLLKTPQLSAVSKPLPRVQFHHNSRCLDGLPAGLSGPVISPTKVLDAMRSSLSWPTLDARDVLRQ